MGVGREHQGGQIHSKRMLKKRKQRNCEERNWKAGAKKMEGRFEKDMRDEGEKGRKEGESIRGAER
jgi:hypothetical protein